MIHKQFYDDTPTKSLMYFLLILLLRCKSVDSLYVLHSQNTTTLSFNAKKQDFPLNKHPLAVLL